MMDLWMWTMPGTAGLFLVMYGFLWVLGEFQHNPRFRLSEPGFCSGLVWLSCMGCFLAGILAILVGWAKTVPVTDKCYALDVMCGLYYFWTEDHRRQ